MSIDRMITVGQRVRQNQLIKKSLRQYFVSNQLISIDINNILSVF